MKKILTTLLLCGLVSTLSARDDVVYFSVSELLNSAKAKEVLADDIKIIFGSGYKGKTIITGITSNKKTNAFNKSDKEACEWSALSALKSFQERARREGGTKVVNLTGYYKKQPFDSKTQFQCGAGNIMAGVTFKGDIAK